VNWDWGKRSQQAESHKQLEEALSEFFISFLVDLESSSGFDH
jgi:hypothetical protein